MESVLFKQLVKIIVIVSIPLAILLLILLKQPVFIVAYLIGIFLGTFRLKALFECVMSLIDTDNRNKGYFFLIKYILTLIIGVGLLIYILYNLKMVGVSILFGLITVPVIIMLYAMYKGISLYKKS